MVTPCCPTKLLQVGLGSFANDWLKHLAGRGDVALEGGVDPDPDQAGKLPPGVPFFTSMETALTATQPDFVLNTAPPGVHRSINHLAFANGLPVLSEKPIAESLEDARATTDEAARLGLPLMIAGNYRRAACMRSLKALLDADEIGAISSIRVEFARCFHTEKPYFLAMPHPLLQDVAIHHLDCVRYLCSYEAGHVTGRVYNPAHSWFPGCANLDFLLGMRNGVTVSYLGTLVSQARKTSWLAHWTIEGSHGALILKEDRITRVRSGDEIAMPCNVPGEHPLDAFLDHLRSGAPLETPAADYLHNHELAASILASSGSGRSITTT